MKKFWLWLCGLIVVCGGGYWGYLATSGYLRAQYATGVAESYIQVQKIPKQNIIDFYPASYDTKSSSWTSTLDVKVKGKRYVYLYAVSLPEKSVMCSVLDANNSGVSAKKAPYPVLASDRD